MARKLTVEDKVEIRRLINQGVKDEEIIVKFKKEKRIEISVKKLDEIKNFKKTY